MHNFFKFKFEQIYVVDTFKIMCFVDVSITFKDKL